MNHNSNPRTTADWQAPRLKRLMSAGESNKNLWAVETPTDGVYGPAS